ncbi:Nsp1-like C-terminal region-domain-containing protein [Whalleya microplaca]|nr:Nsp1-like C-terminal region-domain-containing protein [Whalleya microplaca]
MSFSFGASSAGQSNNATTSSAPATGGLFGSSTTTPTAPSSNLFATSSSGTPSFSFGNLGGGNNTPTTSSGTSSSLFANKPAEQKPSMFGAPANNSTTPGSPAVTSSGGGAAGTLFGAGSQTPTSTSNLFGAAAKPAPAQPGSLFANTPSSSTPGATNLTSTSTAGGFQLFGSKDNKASTPGATGTPGSQPGALFGNTGSPFGGASASNNTPTINAPGLQATPAKPMLSSLNSTTPAGAPPSEAAKPASSPFAGLGSTQQGEKKENQASALFTKPAQPASSAPGANSVFANASQTPKPASNLFGGLKPAENPSSGSMFSAKPPGTQSSGAGSASASSPFGQMTSKPAEASAKPASALFGGAGATPATSSGTLSFGNTATAATTTSSAAAPATTQSSSPFLSLGKPSGINPVSEPGKSQASSLFGAKPSTTAATTEAPKPASNLFGTPAAGAATTEAPKPASNLFGSPATGAATTEQAKPASNLFGASTPAAGATPAATTTSSSAANATAATPAPATTTTTTATPAASSMFGAAPKAATPAADGAFKQTTSAANTNLGASTAGPTSSMARLKNKTMDEIINRWATDLSTYQKAFKDQASQVAQWDRLLVENGEKIQKLYLNTFEAEKASREVERHLVTVESQQEELEAWLDKYEGEVDALFGKQIGHVDQLTGPDQEREKTYKLAEKITERLDDMGRDLTNMIKEINDISGTLSKGNKPDDPLSQIVRVLNGHLTQLQWIDTNAAALQAKVAAAQKASSTIGNQYGGPEQDNVDSFYRSYMGRR